MIFIQNKNCLESIDLGKKWKKGFILYILYKYNVTHRTAHFSEQIFSRNILCYEKKISCSVVTNFYCDIYFNPEIQSGLIFMSIGLLVENSFRFFWVPIVFG